MRVIIAGSRTYPGGIAGVERAVRCSGFDVTTVISGCARGADVMGELWALSQPGVGLERYPADWESYGRRSAGPIRNQQMAEVADALICLWDGSSKGSADMIRRMVHKPTRVYWEDGWGK